MVFSLRQLQKKCREPQQPVDPGRESLREYIGHPILESILKKAIPANQVEGLCEIYEGHKEWLLLFPAFLLQLSEGKYHVGGGSISSKSTL